MAKSLCCALVKPYEIVKMNLDKPGQMSMMVNGLYTISSINI